MNRYMKIMGKPLSSSDNRSAFNAIMMKKRRRLLLILVVGMAIFMFQDTLNWNDGAGNATTKSKRNNSNNNNSNNNNSSSKYNRRTNNVSNNQIIMNHHTRISTVYQPNDKNNNKINNNKGRHRKLRTGTDICSKSPFINADQALKELPNLDLHRNGANANKNKNPHPNAGAHQQPSHVTLCHQLIQRNDAAQKHKDAVDQQAKNKDMKIDPALLKKPIFAKFTIHESMELCTDYKRPHAALMEIISSSIVAYVGRRFGLQYNHHCHSSISPLHLNHPGADDRNNKESQVDFDMTTIQQILPHASMPINERYVQLGEIVHQSCHACIQEHNQGKNHYDTRQQTHHCLAFPIIDQAHSSAIRTEQFSNGNVYNNNNNNNPDDPAYDPYAMPEIVIKQDIVDSQNRLVRTGLGAVLPLVKDRLNHAAVDWAPRSHVPSHDPKSGAVIYLDADTSSGVPFWILERILTKRVTSVSILSGPECARNESILKSMVPGQTAKGNEVTCLQYALELKQYLKNHYKDANVAVSFNLVSSTAAAFTRMILAHTLICLPGTISCLFPALAKTSDRNTVILESPHPHQLVQGSGTFHWFMTLGSIADNVKVIALTPEQLNADQDQLAIQRQYDGFHVEEIMRQGQPGGVVAAGAVQGGAGHGHGHGHEHKDAAAGAGTTMNMNMNLAPKPHADQRDVGGNNEKNNGGYELLEKYVEKGNTVQKEEKELKKEVKVEEHGSPAKVEEAQKPVKKVEDKETILDFDFQGLFGGRR